MTRHTREKYENDLANCEYWNARASEDMQIRVLSYEEWLEEHEWADDYLAYGPMTMTAWRKWKQDVEEEAHRQYYRSYQMTQRQVVLWEQQDGFTKEWYRRAARLSFVRGTAGH